MEQLKNYNFNPNQPLTKPHNEKGVFNAYYKAQKVDTGITVLISKFQQPMYERLLIKHKRLTKLKDIRHPNIAYIYDVIIDKENKTLYVVLEWCQGDSLYEYQKSQSYFDFEVTTKILSQIAQGLKAIHEMADLHRHINMVNVEFSKEGQVKLTFKCLYPKTIYLSPEEKQGTKGKEQQVFSLGILVYKLLFNAVPFDGRSPEQQKASVKKGVNFNRNQSDMFAIAVPPYLKQLLSSMLNPEGANRPDCQGILKAIKNKYFQKNLLPKNIQKKIFANGLIPLFTRLPSSQQQTVLIVLEPIKKQLKKITILHAKKTQIQKYINWKFKYYAQVQEIIGIVPIQKYKILENQYLVIQTFYDNQGSLLFYMQNQGSVKRSNQFIEKLVSKLRAFARNHNHLTKDCIILRKGNFYINFPPIMDNEYLEKIKDDKEKMVMIAPEAREGKDSNKGDGWSVAMLKYQLNNNLLPKFDANGNPNIGRQENVSVEDRQFYKDFLVANANKRGDIKQAQRNKQESVMEESQDGEKQELQRRILDLKKREQQRQKQAKRLKQQQQQQQRLRKLKEEKEYQKKLKDIQQQAKINEIKRLQEEQRLKKLKQQQQKQQIQRRAEHQAKIRREAISKINKHKSKKSFGQLLSSKSIIFQGLQKHWTKPIRVTIKCLIGLILLIFLFYWNFFLINGQLIAEHSIYEQKVVHIRTFEQDSVPDVQYNLVTKTPSQTYNEFYNKTLNVLRDQYRCVLNDYSVDSDVVNIINRSGFTAYQIFGILLCVINLMMFCISLAKMDYPKIFFISKFDENDFTVLWNWMFINMALATQISFSYLLYGSLFHMKLQPCLEKATLTAVEFLLKNWVQSFNIRFIWIYLGLIFSYIVVTFFIVKPQYILRNWMKGCLIALYLGGVFCRIMGGSGDHIAWEKQSVFGKIGQLLLLIISIIFLVIDTIFGCQVKESSNERGNRVNEQSKVQINDTQMMLDD